MLVFVLAACGSDPATAPEPRTFEFGPYPLTAGQEINNQCVSAALDNDEPLYINSVELTTGPGFHHSNWFWVPDNVFAGPDGTWKCDDRQYDEANAGIYGGVLFAQSTQAQHEVQTFPEGAAIVIPPHSRIVAGTHLLNTGEDALSVPLTLKITPIAEATTPLAAMSFTNESITLPPHRVSRMSMECDLKKIGNLPSVSFKVYYALAHYHELGRAMAIDAVRDDGTTSTIFTTAGRVGDALGGTINPLFDMTGFSKIRYYCEFDNERDVTVRWGVGDQEMCTFLSFIDGDFKIAGGALNYNETPTITDNGAYIDYAYPCDLVASPQE
jgi:hypothetical protein